MGFFQRIREVFQKKQPVSRMKGYAVPCNDGRAKEENPYWYFTSGVDPIQIFYGYSPFENVRMTQQNGIANIVPPQGHVFVGDPVNSNYGHVGILDSRVGIVGLDDLDD